MTRMASIALLLASGVLCVRCSKAGEGALATASASPGAAGAGREAAMVVIPPDSPQLRQIEVEEVRTAEVPEDEVVAPGRIEAVASRVARIVPPVPGRIDRVLVRLGDTVAAGQALITIDSPDGDAALSEYRQAQAALSQARSALVKTKADCQRSTDLFEHKAVARKEVLAAENDLTQAQATLDQAEAASQHARHKTEILGLENGSSGHQVTVRAPLPGKVIELSVTAGEYRTDTTAPLMTVADLTTVWVTSAVPENAIRLIELGERVQVEMVAYPGEVFEARVKRIADTLDPKTRTVQVQAELDNRHGKLRPEMFGRIRHAHSSRAVPVVPARAVLRRGSDTVVFVERGRGRYALVPVSIGPTHGDRVPVLKGLGAGERVVTGGVMLLSGIEAR